jgi:patatin-like phospholipase/acyl hydrolase
VKRTVKILSIDGGGIRGLIPALVLKELEDRLRDCTKGGALASTFDLIAGTSTGAFITIGLTLPKRYPERYNTYLAEPALNAADIADFYLRRGAEVFPQSLFNGFRVMAHVFREKYDEERLERILEEVVGAATLAECLTHVLIPAYDTERCRPFYFRSGSLARSETLARRLLPEGLKALRIRDRRDQASQYLDRGDELDLNFFLKDVARAASAAPSYFPPAHISPVPDNGQKYCLIDGGIFAPNPALCAYIEARRLFPRARDFLVVSLGTGRVERSYSCSDLRDWGYLEWVSPAKKAPLPSIMIKAQNEMANRHMRSLPDVRFYRFNAPLAGANDEMDDASTRNISGLQRIAEKIVRQNDEEIDALCREIRR